MAAHTKRLKINVTKQCIRKGERENGAMCPIALACKAVDGVESASVDTDEITIEGSCIPIAGGHIDGKIIFSTPKKAQRFITAFDAGRKPKPMTLLL